MINTLRGHKKKILVVEDNPLLGELLSHLLDLEGAEAKSCGSGHSIQEIVGEQGCEVYVVSDQLQGMNGLTVVAALRKLYPASYIIGTSAENRRLDFMEAGADDFLLKPFEIEQLVNLLAVRSQHSAGA